MRSEVEGFLGIVEQANVAFVGGHWEAVPRVRSDACHAAMVVCSAANAFQPSGPQPPCKPLKQWKTAMGTYCGKCGQA